MLPESNRPIPPSAEHTKFVAGLQEIVNGDRSSVRFESTVLTRKNQLVAVETVLTRMRRGGSLKGEFSIHLSWVDITDLKSLLETNQKIFEHASRYMYLL